MAPDQLERNYARALEALERACDKAGRRREALTLVAVSKFHSAEDVAAIARLGQIDFGENYLQEAEKKRGLLADLPGLRWHMTGHVQHRKAAAAALSFEMTHTLDSARLADAMEKALALKNQEHKALIEVNIAGEPQKAGVAAEDLKKLAEHVEASCPHLKLVGLMCMPPVFDNGEAARPHFAKLYELRESLGAFLGRPLPHLSMGMSGDFPAAIEEGATIVRIGTEIFGPRPPKAPAFQG